MTKINTENWKEFRVGDLFDISGSTTTPKNELNFEDSAPYPYITTAATNNGIGGYTSVFTENGGVLTVDSAVAGTVLYQEKCFTASDHVEKLIPKFEMNQAIAMYLCTLLNASAKKYGYAYNEKRSQKALKNETIVLPVTPSGTPDWDYMDTYIENLKIKAENKIKKAKIVVAEPKKVINTDNWGVFKVGELFEVKKISGDLQAPKLNEGNFPLVSAGSVNNGISKFIEKQPDKFPVFDNCISVDMFGKAFYHPYEFYAVAHARVNVLKPFDDINKNVALFLCAAIEAVTLRKYSFEQMCSQTAIKNETIKLPITPDGQPNWEYMENYIENLKEKINLNY